MKFRGIDLLVCALTLLLLSVAIVQGIPSGSDTLTVGKSERAANNTPKSTVALAGNVTALDLTGRSVTKYWQGYFGNITGTVVLADSSNYTLYEWATADPQAEIYAARTQSINWINSIDCANLTTIEIEDNTTLGVNQTADVDTVNKTFDRTDHPALLVGGNPTPISGCRSTSVNHSGTGNGYYEVLLQDNNSGTIIYTAYVPQGNYTGFDGGQHDFQMLVAEKGNGAEEYPNGGTTTYFFFVELG
ncbi:MAG: hypothetical protein AABX51_09110 [Nanoarchaeota archaeon]